MKQLKIGTMAEVCSTTPRALRHYQDEGILQPEIVDEESGYRSYSIMQSTKLDMITQLQSAGFTLREIAQIENAKDIDYLHDQAQARSAELERQIQELMLAKRPATTSCSAASNTATARCAGASCSSASPSGVSWSLTPPPMPTRAARTTTTPKTNAGSDTSSTPSAGSSKAAIP